MIPENICEFLTRQIFMHVGSRDGKLRPREIMAWGVKVEEDKKSVTFFIPEAISEKTLNNLKDNGRVALTCVYVNTHETYQLKGRYLSHRSSTDSENNFMDIYIEGYKEVFKIIGMPPEFFSPLKYKPAVVVKFEVQGIFVQTPGPNAGNKIY